MKPTYCNLCGEPCTITPDRHVCDKCYNAIGRVRLFHGEDILALMKRFNIGTLFDVPCAADSIESISKVRLENFVIVNGELTFTVHADVKFKEDEE